MELNTIGTVTTWNDAAQKINSNFEKIGVAIQTIESVGIGVITSPDDSIKIETTSDGLSIGVIANNLVASKSGLFVTSNKIGVAIDPSEGNRLVMTPTGLLRVDSENLWQKME